MSKVAELAYDIEQLYIEGHSPRMIATILECPVEIVYDWIDSVGVGGALELDEYSPYDTINS